jgi:hypothetical protein
VFGVTALHPAGDEERPLMLGATLVPLWFFGGCDFAFDFYVFGK